MEKQIPKLKKFGKLKQLMIGLAKPLLLVYGIQQLTYLGNTLYHELQPSSPRVAFEKEFGFPLRGYQKDIEERESDLSILSNVIQQEQLEMPFLVSSLRVESGNPLQQSVMTHVGQNLLTGYSGYFNPVTRAIVITSGANRATLHHEIKHAKTFDLLMKHPQFRDEWNQLSKDDHGNSLYCSGLEQVCIRVRGLHRLIKKDKFNSLENEQLGFVSDYAGTNFYEDIAELCEEIEFGNSRFREWLFGEGRSPRIIAKVALAEKYGLIPKGYSEFILLDKSYSDAWEYGGWHGYLNLKKVEHFLQESENFLREHPESKYVPEVRSSRACIYQETARSDKKFVEKTLKEYQAILRFPHKEMAYALSLDRLHHFYQWTLEDEQKSKIFQEANQLYWKRFHEGDIMLSKHGVNDFLVVQEALEEK